MSTPPTATPARTTWARFASRGTHRVGNAVTVAAREARGVMMEAAAEELEVNAGDLDTDGLGNIHVKGAPHRKISTKDVAIAAQFKQGKTIAGRGIFLVPLSEVDPETGEMTPGDLLRPCLPRRRSRGRRRDRRSRDDRDELAPTSLAARSIRKWSSSSSSAAPGWA